MTIDFNTILSVITFVSIIILIIYEIVKHYFKNSFKIWTNAYELLKERNEQLKNDNANLEGQLDFQYETFQNEIQELKDKYKKSKNI